MNMMRKSEQHKIYTIDCKETTQLYSLYLISNLFLIEMNTFIQQAINLIKSGSKDIYNITKNVFYVNAVLNFLFIKESWIKCIWSNEHKTLKKHLVIKTFEQYSISHIWITK